MSLQALFFRFGWTVPKTLHFVADKISYRTPPQVIFALEYSVYGVDAREK